MPEWRAAPGSRELTLPALGAGCVIGILLCIANVYMGLKSGWWDSGSITGSILAFALLSAWGRARRSAHGVLENNLAQAVAASAGAMPAAAGLLGAVPALALMGRPPPPWAVAALGLGLGALGILLALSLRRRLLEEEGLAFPTGVATSEVITALHSGRGGASRALTLAGSGAASGVVLLLRDLAGVVPQVTALPGRVGGLTAGALGVGVSWSPLLVGVGMVAGPRTGLSMLLGAVIAWLGLAPPLVQGGHVPASDYASLVGWLTWPGVALILGASAASMAAQARTLRGTLADLASAGVRGGWRGGSGGRLALIALASLAVVAVAGRLGFGLDWLHTGGALLLSVLLASVCARAVGQTDIAPVGEMGQVTQAVAGALAPGYAALNVATGHVVAGEAAQVGVTLWSLQSGRRLGASPTLLTRGMLLGAVIGTAVAVPGYLLLARVHGLGTAGLPAPFAIQWKAVAAVMSAGEAALPRWAGMAAAMAFLAGAVLEGGGRGRAGRFLPSPTALGMGFLMPASYAVAVAMGALAATAFRRAWPETAEAHLQALAAGAIAGESTLGFLLAALTASGHIHAG